MDSAEARRKLLLYRPEVDRDEPEFAEALAMAARDKELGNWLQRRIEADAAIGARLAQVAVPEDLAAKIIRERPVPFPARHRWRSVLSWAAIAVILAGLAGWWIEREQRTSFLAYEQYVARMLGYDYRMDLQSPDLRRIRSYLKDKQAPADFALGTPLQNATPLGCGTLRWNANPVSMVCFTDPSKQKIFLFIVNQRAISDPPARATPTIRQVGDYSTASWTTNGQAYLLTVKGGPDILQKYL